MDSLAIETHGLTKTFDGKAAVRDLGITVPAGTVFGFLGPNGAGKTTSIRMLLGLLKPSSGEARVLGRSVTAEPGRVREQVGVLLDHPGLYERLSARANLAFHGDIYHLDPAVRDARIRSLLERFDLWGSRDEPVGSFSKGMKQKLALARALLHEPRLLFLDEPTTGLDPASAVALREGITSLARERNVTVFLTSHNLLEVEKVCGLIGVIRRGELLFSGTSEELQSRTSSPGVEIVGTGFSPEALAKLRGQPFVERVETADKGILVFLKEERGAAEIVTLLVGAGVAVEGVKKGGPGLESAFLELTKDDS